MPASSGVTLALLFESILGNSVQVNRMQNRLLFLLYFMGLRKE